MTAAVAPAPPQQDTPAPSTGAGSPRRDPAGLLRELNARWNDRTALVLIGIAATVLGLWNLTGATLYMDDEGTYTAQAFSVLEGRLAPYTYWYDHPPLGWIQLGVLAWIPHVLGLGDGTWIGATRYAVVPFFVATTLLVYLIARRLGIRPPIAVLTVAVFVLSPLSLTFGRQVFLDNVGLPWLLLAFWMVLSPRTALWPHVWAGAFFAIAVLSKETLAIFGPALMLALLNRPSWANRTFSVIGFLVVGGLVLSFYPLTAMLRGELGTGNEHVSLQDALTYQLMSRSGSGSVWDAESNAAEHLNAWLTYDQHLIVVGLAAALLCLLRRRTIWIPVALATFAVPVLLGSGYLPAMYVIGALPFLALAVGVGLDVLWDAARRMLDSAGPAGRPLGGTAMIGLAAASVLAFAPQWAGQTATVLTRQTNDDWAATLAWVRDNVPVEDTVLVPYAMWQDLNEAGRHDPWSVVAIEKADLDPEFLTANPNGWEDVEWVVIGPFTHATIKSHGLTIAGEAVENAKPVQIIGDWSVHRVQVP